ncbi:hypothetical protein OYT1_ch1606 [Ferriphaselus amnicola]|uniref:HEPN domain-containing protein n=1 Tax=Ferriphaselus amnicola TaxID=1188319 RepID=A0A2Z6GC50_9PROT|nr:hypothetical protein [Ferriphaselus amnicola]BBE51153.1 hypothetical protein OYT1_ch1606 [Ferriphaselus amnicola]
MIQPTDFLNAADSIRQQGSTEMDFRTGVNRAYYAAYHAALDAVTRLGLPAAREGIKGSHEQVYSRLIDCTQSFAGTPDRMRKAQSIGYVARKVLKPNRVHADYNLNDPVEKTVLEDTYAKAALIVGNAKAL